MARVPPLRVRAVNRAPVRPEGDHVVYWMIAARRATFSFALQRAVERAGELGKPLVVLEALRVGYPWASDRLHRLVLDGMADNRRRFARRHALYHPYVEPEPGHGKGLLEALSERACVVVTDDFPTFFLPRMVKTAGARLAVRLEAVDGNGLLPLRAADRAYPTAHAFRRFLHRALPPHLREMPAADPLEGVDLPRLETLPRRMRERWPAAPPGLLEGDESALATLPIDHDVPPVRYAGGTLAAVRHLRRWLDEGLPRYADGRNDPDDPASSGLSPHLHFGHLSTHQIFTEIAERQSWSVDQLPMKATGKKEGWWKMDGAAEAFLDELVVWRELGHNVCAFRDDHDRYESLPDWARDTLEAHAGDERPYSYDLGQLERAETHDQVWNAAQRQLLAEGCIHNYLRMLWGKKILEWTPHPRDALAVMTELNDKLAVDGRDPNSESGIFWCLGRHDRPWPERPVFGKVRCMTSESTRRKLRMAEYLARWGGS